MKQTIQQAVQANKLELERLLAIYTEISEYANQKYRMTTFELDNAIEEADEFDQRFNRDNLQKDTFYYE